MPFNIMEIMIRCLLYTIMIECVVAFIIGIRKRKDFFNIILANCITNPIVVTIPIYFNLKYGVLERRIALLILEIVTVISEGIIYKKVLEYKKINPITVSLILNISSYLIGEIINIIVYS